MRRLLMVSTTFTLLVLGGCGINATDPGEGEKVGQVIKLTNQGVFSTTWEAELIRGGLSNGSGGFGVKPFDFTVPNKLAEKVREYMENQTEVKIKYHSSGIYNLFSTDSGGHYLVSIEPLKK